MSLCVDSGCLILLKIKNSKLCEMDSYKIYSYFAEATYFSHFSLLILALLYYLPRFQETHY